MEPGVAGEPGALGGDEVIPSSACGACGLVRLGAGPVQDVGSVANLLGRLEPRLRDHQGLKVTEAQRRLILGRMRTQLVGPPGVVSSKKEEAKLLATIVAHYTGLPRESVASHLCSC